MGRIWGFLDRWWSRLAQRSGCHKTKREDRRTYPSFGTSAGQSKSGIQPKRKRQRGKTNSIPFTCRGSTWRQNDHMRISSDDILKASIPDFDTTGAHQIFEHTTAKMHIDRRPMDSMKSTWRSDKSQWGFYHHFLNTLNVFHNDPNKDIPVHAKTDKMPYLTQWSCHLWIILHAAWPVLIQHAYQHFTGRTMHPFAAMALYTVGMQLNSIHEIHVLRRLGHKFGFLDGDKHARDEVPDVGVQKVFNSLELTTTIRPVLAIMLSYRRSFYPSLSWWLPVELVLYSVVLDFWFYLYHRSCHELDSLWQYHRTHHLTKHPNPLLSSYADSEQEFIEIALVPFLTYATLKYAFGLPMGFHDWWLCHEYIIFSEAFGHSGLRIYSSAVSLANPILSIFNCELQIEDHDLHHRKGWRQSYNYGKQTRLWDKLFGTCADRIEAVETNVDWDQKVILPLI